MDILALCIFIFNVAIVIFGNKQWIDNFGFTVWKNIYLGKNTILLMILIWLYSLIGLGCLFVSLYLIQKMFL